VEESKAQMIALWLSFYGLEHVLAFTVCLMIGRYWQALLYNPGGFRQEFYSLQVDARVMVVLLALIVAGLAGLQPLDDWMLMFFVIPGLCGLAVAHYVIAARKMGTGGIVLTYLIAVVYAPLIVMVGFADRWFDIRKRIKKKD
jgi:hypothetical protein